MLYAYLLNVYFNVVYYLKKKIALPSYTFI